MVEMLGVLAIVGVLSIGAIAGYNKISVTQKTQALTDKIYYLQSQIRNVSNGNYVGVNKSVLLQTGKFQDEDFQNPFGGDIYVGPDSDGYLVLAVKNNAVIPSDACTDLVLTNWGKKGIFWGLSLGTVVNDVYFAYWNDTYPAQTSAAISACSGGDKLMYWYFK